jgi:hypothetical protein
MKLPISQLFLAPVVPLDVGAVLSFMLMRLWVNRDKGRVLYEKEEQNHASFAKG